MWYDPYSGGSYGLFLEHWQMLQWHQQQWHQWTATQWTDGCAHSHGGSSSSGAAVQPQQDHRPTEQETIERLVKIKDELEGAAWTKLQNALNIVLANEIATELSTCIERAIFFLDYLGTDSSPRGAVDALRQT